MQIPMVVRERTVRVQASIPAGQADALKALAAASGVPLSRAVHYAVERLLAVAGREGVLALAAGLAPASPPETGGDSVAEVAEALQLRVPEAGPEHREPVRPNGEPAPERPGEQGSEQGPGHGGEHVAASQAEPPAYPAADAAAGADRRSDV